MDPPFAARFPFEMLDRVRDVNRVAVDPRLLQRAIEELSGRTDEWLAAQVLLVARLLAEQHHRRLFWYFAENGLGRILVERAGGTAGGRFPQSR